MVDGEGFEPPNNKELVYSQPRLATSLPIPSSPDRTRTYNPLINSQLLCQLSYQGVATLMGLEPTTTAVTGQCSNQLSYKA